MPAETKDSFVRFRVSRTRVEQFTRAAEAECMSLSEWLRRLALIRVAELGDRIENGAAE